MIGLDAADHAYIERHRAELPNIARFLGDRPLDLLKVEPLSGAVWSSFITGTRPGHHGIYHHMQWDPETMQIRRTHPDWIGAVRPFWRKLAHRGAKVAAFDVPFSFKGNTEGALEVANWGSHDLVEEFWCSDPAIERKVRAIANLHPMGFEVPVRKSRTQLRAILDDIVSGVALKAEQSLMLMDQEDWDLFVVAFGETHRGGHIFWPQPDDPASPIPGDALLSIYQAIDTAVGRLLARADGGADVVLFSLHGMAANQSQSHLSQGMLEHALRGPGVGDDEKQTSGFGLIRELRRKVPHRLQHAIAERVPTVVRDFVHRQELVGGLNWANTPAFSLQGDVSGYWRFNIAGREAQGCVDADQHSDLAKTLADAFSSFRTLDGQQLISRVLFPSGGGSGGRAHLLPDIVAEWNSELDAVDRAEHPELGQVSGQLATGRSGNHRFTGFFAHRGPSEGQITEPPAHICDLAQLAKTVLSQRSELTAQA